MIETDRAPPITIRELHLATYMDGTGRAMLYDPERAAAWYETTVGPLDLTEHT